MMKLMVRKEQQLQIVDDEESENDSLPEVSWHVPQHIILKKSPAMAFPKMPPKSTAIPTATKKMPKKKKAPLRFAVGELVEANVGDYKVGKVIKHWDDGNAYRIGILEEDFRNVWAPIDHDEYVRAPRPPLRFAVGDRVEASMGDYYLPGRVLKHWDDGNPYRIRLDEDDEEVWAEEDHDGWVRAPRTEDCPYCHCKK